MSYFRDTMFPRKKMPQNYMFRVKRLLEAAGMMTYEGGSIVILLWGHKVNRGRRSG